jgi:hypothetical protein
MLKIEVSNDVGYHVEATGRVKDILTELAIVFNTIYHQMTAGDQVAEKIVKDMLRFAIMDDNSPFWKNLNLGADATAIRIEIPQK